MFRRLRNDADSHILFELGLPVVKDSKGNRKKSAPGFMGASLREIQGNEVIIIKQNLAQGKRNSSGAHIS